MQRKGFFSRLADLFRGIFGLRLKEAEARNAEAVYHQAIVEHERHHERLKAALSRMVYLRNRMHDELRQREADGKLIEQALGRSVVADEDDRALALIAKRRAIVDEVERLRGEMERLAAHAEKTKEGLKEVATAVKKLKVERDEMLARKAYALARRDVQLALKQLTDAGTLAGSTSALDSVRESILALEQSIDIDDETEVQPGEISLEALRREAVADADRDTLQRMKVESKGRLLPMPATAAGGNGNVFNAAEVLR